MSLKNIVRTQMIARVNKTAERPAHQISKPNEGWIQFVRNALGMSGTQLGKRLSRSRSRISQAEKAEPDGGVTLRTMDVLAKGLGCRFVYAFIPETGSIEDVIEAQARNKATAIVTRAAIHMALEKQALTEQKNREEIERLTQEMLRNPPSDFWDAV